MGRCGPTDGAEQRSAKHPFQLVSGEGKSAEQSYLPYLRRLQA